MLTEARAMARCLLCKAFIRPVRQTYCKRCGAKNFRPEYPRHDLAAGFPSDWRIAVGPSGIVGYAYGASSGDL